MPFLFEKTDRSITAISGVWLLIELIRFLRHVCLHFCVLSEYLALGHIFVDKNCAIVRFN